MALGFGFWVQDFGVTLSPKPQTPGVLLFVVLLSGVLHFVQGFRSKCGDSTVARLRGGCGVANSLRPCDDIKTPLFLGVTHALTCRAQGPK